MTDHAVPQITPLRVPFHQDVAHVLPEAPRALLLAAHGWGQRADRFIRPLLPLANHGLAVVVPQAPHPFYLDIETRKVGFSWMTAYERDRAVADLCAYLAQVRSHFDPDARLPCFLLGFSQGVSIATRFAVSGLLEPAGLIACCADLPPDAAERLPDTGPFPALVAYSPEDGIVPPAKSQEAAAAFRAHGFPVTEHPFDGGHRLAPALIAEVGEWIAARLP